jgi:hypothetical protein
MSRDSSVNTMTTYGLNDVDSLPGRSILFYLYPGNQDSSVGIATVLGLDHRTSILSRGNTHVILPAVSGSGAHPDCYPVGSGIKWPGHEADHSLSSSAEVKSGCATPPFLYTFSWRDA